MSWNVKWCCPLCGAEGTIDPVNSPDLAVEMMIEIHRLFSPGCPNAQPLNAQAREPDAPIYVYQPV